MSDIFINQEELKESDEMITFLKTLNPEMQERFKIIAWWESLKPKEPDKAAAIAN